MYSRSSDTESNGLHISVHRSCLQLPFRGLLGALFRAGNCRLSSDSMEINPVMYGFIIWLLFELISISFLVRDTQAIGGATVVLNVVIRDG
jgi:hypothetical protein